MGFISELDPWTTALVGWGLLVLFLLIALTTYLTYGKVRQSIIMALKVVEPKALHEGASLVIFAKNQPEYDPLPASVDESGTVMTEWALTESELAVLVAGGRIRVWMLYAVAQDPHTGKQRPMIPMAVEVV